jgi:hypothetical protein
VTLRSALPTQYFVYADASHDLTILDGRDGSPNCIPRQVNRIWCSQEYGTVKVMRRGRDNPAMARRSLDGVVAAST